MKYEFEEVERIIIKNAFDLKRYLKTLDKTFDDNYKKNFNAYYGVRRNEKWRNAYYDFFEKNKNNENITFEEIIEYLCDNTEEKNVEPSFSSKMLATINPNKPIWDKYVLKHLKIRVKEKDKDKKIEEAINIYKKIEEKYKEYLEDNNIKETINRIKKILNDERISDIKILDYIIWITEKEENK